MKLEKATETCGCGASFAYESWSAATLRAALEDWRTNHAHTGTAPAVTAARAVARQSVGFRGRTDQ